MYSNIYINIGVKLIIIVLYYIFYKYTLYLEEIHCSCSNNWKRDYIKHYSSISMIIITSKLLNNSLTKIVNPNVLYTIYLLDIIFGAFYAIVLYNYTKELKESECKCSETWSRDFMYNYSLLILGLYIIIYFASITALIQTRVFMTLITTLFNSKKAGLFKYISKFKITSNYLK